MKRLKKLLKNVSETLEEKTENVRLNSVNLREIPKFQKKRY